MTSSDNSGQPRACSEAAVVDLPEPQLPRNATAVDRTALLKSTLGGHGSLGFAIPWFYWQDAEPTADQLGSNWKYDPAEAKKLMTAAG